MRDKNQQYETVLIPTIETHKSWKWLRRDIFLLLVEQALNLVHDRIHTRKHRPVWVRGRITSYNVCYTKLLRLLVFVLNSQAGAQWTLDRLTAMSETDIRYSLLEGTLLDGLSLTQFLYRDEGQQAEIDRLEVRNNFV